MTPLLTPRLEMVLSLVPNSDCCCDIGTDHGYLAIALAQRCTRVIAADVNPGPLSAAKENIGRYGAKNVQLRLSDGFSAIAEGEADCAVIAGMGGELIARLLSGGTKGITSFVLQPQSLVHKLRRYLWQNGFLIEDEALCRDDGRFYVAMRVVMASSRPLSEAEERIGPVLLKKRPELLSDYIEDEIRKLRLAQSKIGNAETANRAEYERLISLYGGIING